LFLNQRNRAVAFDDGVTDLLQIVNAFSTRTREDVLSLDTDHVHAIIEPLAVSEDDDRRAVNYPLGPWKVLLDGREKRVHQRYGGHSEDGIRERPVFPEDRLRHLSAEQEDQQDFEARHALALAPARDAEHEQEEEVRSYGSENGFHGVVASGEDDLVDRDGRAVIDAEV
jgi:hypothetical protein